MPALNASTVHSNGQANHLTGGAGRDLYFARLANKLTGHDGRKAELVKLRFFAGLTIRQAAEALGIAESTADADWAYAKAWLRLELSDASDLLS